MCVSSVSVSATTSSRHHHHRAAHHYNQSRTIYTSLIVMLTLNYWVTAVLGSAVYMTDSWAIMNNNGMRQRRPRCVDIPHNFSLCHGIDYSRMRLPNLLEHESMTEVVQQSRSWQPLIGLNCHADTRLFLCSLFAPVCLNVDRTIPPCQSLCLAVQTGCEPRMKAYGFAWPDMLKCSQYPKDTDMCIQPRQQYVSNETCELCEQVDTYENILDHYCRSEYVAKVKLRVIGGRTATVRSGQSLKQLVSSLSMSMSSQSEQSRRSGRGSRRRRVLQGRSVHYSNDDRLCQCQFQQQAKSIASNKLRKKKYLLMANTDVNGRIVASMLLPWKKSKQFKKAIRTFRKIDCSSLGRVIRDSAIRRHSTVYPGPYTTQYDEPFY